MYDPTGMWQQEHVTMMKHAHRVSNLAKEDVKLSILVEESIKHGALSMVE